MPTDTDSPKPTAALDTVAQRIASLSPAKRALLEMRLNKTRANLAADQTIPRRANRKECPLSFSQQRLWFLHQFDPESPVYNIARAIRITGCLNADALRMALNTIVARHEVLRTTFAAVDGTPVQIIGEARQVEFSVIGLSQRSELGREAYVRDFVRAEIQRPLDLRSDLMLRCALLRFAEQDHALVVTTHHIASDGWSSSVFFEELAGLYEAFAAGKPSPLPDLPVQYGDFAVWQRHWLQGDVLDSQLSYWKKQLSNAPALLELPLDNPRPKIQSFRGARQSIRLSKQLTEALRTLSKREGATLFMTMVSAFKVLLFRYTAQEDILVGVPVANRRRAELERLIGFFVNNLVLRTDLSGNPTFQQLLHRVREASLSAYAHQDVPFEKLIEQLQPERSLSHSPLFQVMFGFQTRRRHSVELPDLTMSTMDVETGTAKFDLFLSMVEEPEALRGSLEYNTDLFEAATVTRILIHFQTLLEAVVRNPAQRISDLPLLTESEKQQLLVDWNDTNRAYPDDLCVQQLFEAQVNRSPQAVAAVFHDEEVTYRELNQRANQLAHYLRTANVGPEVLVGICLERSLEMVVAVLAVLKAGGAYVPLDPSFPKERLAFMLDDSGAGVLLTQQSLIELIPACGARRICIDKDAENIAQESEEAPRCQAGPDNLAYVIYTSGSTGKPKGVQIVHRAVVNFLSSMRREPGLTEKDVLASVTTLSFDIAALEIFLPLSVGAQLVLVDSHVAADGTRLAALLERSGATVMQATPATWRLLMEAQWQPSRPFKALCGGESLSPELADYLLASAASVWNMYGPTETTIWSATTRVERGNKPISIGRPIDNTQIYILDPRLNPVPVGVPGELYIGGAGLARGYKNRPELVAEKFIPNPFCHERGARLYRTGDRARYRPNGEIEFLGRIDYQVKIRGFRIELGEIETLLRQHPSVSQAVVTDRIISGDRRLVAYTVASNNGRASATEFRDFLRNKLPDYMIPSHFVSLEAFPLTPNGKLDRRGLPDPNGSRSDSEDVLGPRDIVDLTLSTIWADVLGLQSIGVGENFFEIGGHSLLAVRLFARIEKQFGKKLPLATLFQAPTIEQLANVLRQQDSIPSWSSLVAIQPLGTKPPFFCVHAHGGNVLNFNGLARHLGRDQPFYGLQAHGLDGRDTRQTSIEEMAAAYIKEIRTVQPHGPYLLGGYCFGGKVAFEMGHLLRAEGEEVLLLALIDSYAPGYPKLLPWPQRRVAQLRLHWNNLQKLGTHEKLSYFKAKGTILSERAATALRRVAAGVFLNVGFSLPAALQNIPTVKQKQRRQYNPTVYPGKIDVFAPTEGPSIRSIHQPSMGWEALAAEGLEINVVPGKFASIILEPSVKLLAQRLRGAIDRALARRNGQSLPKV